MVLLCYKTQLLFYRMTYPTVVNPRIEFKEDTTNALALNNIGIHREIPLYVPLKGQFTNEFWAIFTTPSRNSNPNNPRISCRVLYYYWHVEQRTNVSTGKLFGNKSFKVQ